MSFGGKEKEGGDLATIRIRGERPAFWWRAHWGEGEKVSHSPRKKKKRKGPQKHQKKISI